MHLCANASWEEARLLQRPLPDDGLILIDARCFARQQKVEAEPSQALSSVLI